MNVIENPEPTGIHIPTGAYEETRTKIDETDITLLYPFSTPTDALGTALDLDIGSFGQKDIRFGGVFGKKESRLEMGTGDSLLVFTFRSPTGLCILADIEDGFTPVSETVWRQYADQSRGQLPISSDVFFNQLNYYFARSPELSHWMEHGTGIIQQLSPKVDTQIHIPNHASPVIEIALKEVVRSYLIHKNDFRKRQLGDQFSQTPPGKELANGIFGVSCMFLPNEAAGLPETSDTTLSGSSIGGFAVARSLADIGITTTFPDTRVFLTDANAFFDKFAHGLQSLLTEEQILKMRAMIYGKIDQLYAAFNERDIIFPLTEEESLSGPITDVASIFTAGATDGAYFLTREHDGDPRVNFLRAVTTLVQSPLNLAAQMRHPKDDYLAYSLKIQ